MTGALTAGCVRVVARGVMDRGGGVATRLVPTAGVTAAGAAMTAGLDAGLAVEALLSVLFNFDLFVLFVFIFN